jgi:hypothetical protein
MEKPEHMIDELTSGSSSSSEEGEGGISACSQALGDGASLYLQMMKTLAIMFAILSIVNIPILMIYENNTQGNQLDDLSQVFKYFTIGNLG